MKLLPLLSLSAKQLVRRPLRTGLTILGVAASMSLFTAIESLQQSLATATEQTAGDTTLVVYRENRFCPATSRLPEHYEQEIRTIPNVREVIPIQIVVNNCGASLDVIAFRGVPGEALARYAPEIEVIEGSADDWLRRDDGALIGEQFARRRGLSAGDRFDAVGIVVHVSGIIRSPFAQDNNVAYVKLPFLQQASRAGLGVVTQFNVRVDSSQHLKPVAAAIDQRFQSDQQPTNTRPEKAFFAETAGQLIELVKFTRWMGIGAVAAVLALVGNAIVLAVRGNRREHAILRTLGYPRRAIAMLVMADGALVGIGGGLVGAALAAAFLHWRSFTLGSEGLTLAVRTSSTTILFAIVVSLLLGVTASAFPAWRASRRPITESLQA